jgi:H+/Cl- antiporter ClcA
MSAIRIIAFIAAAILILFGVLFIWAAFGEHFNSGWLVTGLISVAIGFGLIWFGARSKAAVVGSGDVTLKIDLPANVDLDSLTCRACGSPVTTDEIKMIAGAPVVTCSYCGTTYQLTEEPKW